MEIAKAHRVRKGARERETDGERHTIIIRKSFKLSKMNLLALAV